MNPATIKRYGVPGVIAAVALTAILVLPRGGRADAIEAPPEIIEIPRGRIMNIVVERDGPYVGSRAVPAKDFVAYIRAICAKERVDHVLVYGRADAKYGDFVAAYVGLREVFGERTHVCTYPLESGTQLPDVRLQSNWWW